MTREEKLQLLSELCLEFGPTGSERYVAKVIKEKLGDTEYTVDRLGNIIVHIPGEGAPKLMVSAHMDEVGFIINEITDDGYLKFDTLGGIDPRVMCGKYVTVEGKEGFIPGVIAAKAIHHQNADERKKVTPYKSMYIDIGATSREEAESLTELGNSATFDSEFVIFGEDGAFIKSKAIDDRIGCAVLLDLLGRLPKNCPFDLYFCFTVREEIGLSGARTVAHAIDPDFCIVLESTAVADLPDVPESRRVAKLGDGCAISLRDNAQFTTAISSILPLKRQRRRAWPHRSRSTFRAATTQAPFTARWTACEPLPYPCPRATSIPPPTSFRRPTIFPCRSLCWRSSKTEKTYNSERIIKKCLIYLRKFLPHTAFRERRATPPALLPSL